MGLAMEMTKAYFDTKGMHYREIPEKNTLSTGVKGLKNKGDIVVIIAFDDDDKGVAIRSYDYCRVSDDKLQDIFRVCSEVNARFRWIKFYVDSDDHTVSLEDDAVIQPDSCGEEIFELIMRMAGIADEAYPEFMKALWA